MDNRAARIAAAAATLLLSGAPVTVSAKDTAKVQCEGVNSCKGKSACNSANNSCKGQNACKGKGWLEMTEKECKAKGGKIGSGGGMEKK